MNTVSLSFAAIADSHLILPQQLLLLFVLLSGRPESGQQINTFIYIAIIA